MRDADTEKNEETSRSIAAEALRYVRLEAAQRPTFETLAVGSDEIKAANEKRDSLLHAAMARYANE